MSCRGILASAISLVALAAPPVVEAANTITVSAAVYSRSCGEGMIDIHSTHLYGISEIDQNGSGKTLNFESYIWTRQGSWGSGQVSASAVTTYVPSTQSDTYHTGIKQLVSPGHWCSRTEFKAVTRVGWLVIPTAMHFENSTGWKQENRCEEPIPPEK